jgi:hypothetical protein
VVADGRLAAGTVFGGTAIEIISAVSTEISNGLCMTRLKLIAAKHLMPDVTLCSPASFEADSARYTS